MPAYCGQTSIGTLKPFARQRQSKANEHLEVPIVNKGYGMTYLMAIDAGTGSVRAVIFDENGNQISLSAREWHHFEDSKYPGSMDFDWITNWSLACSCVKDAIAKSGLKASQIAAVSTTCMREGIVLYDAAGKEIWACANVDARAVDEVAQLKKISPELEKELYIESGQTFALGALPRLLWVKNKLPEVYKKIARIGMFNDWLIYKLSGVLAVEPSNGCTTGLFDLQTRTWDKTIARRCGLKDDIFPIVLESTTLVSKVSPRGAVDSGLVEGTQLVVGGGDCQLGTIGVGVVNANEAAVFGGSFWQYEYNTDIGAASPKCDVRVNCHAIPKMRQYEALAFNPGLVMRWYRDAFCGEEKRIAEDQRTDPYELMDIEAAKIPAGCYGMFCTFSDVMNYISWRHASPSFLNFALDPNKFNKYTFYRSIMENTALVTLGHVKLVETVIGKCPTKIVFAGGAAKSNLWPQILADVLQITVQVPVVKEATALGAAIIAGKGIGLYNDIGDAAAKLAKIEKVFNPDPKNAEVYKKAYSTWRAAYDSMLKLSGEKITKYMWAAPGL
ncbi:MAG: autoinducer-2 kinase [Termitinemataceae bacterium]|nr:MAG: autoinducer-2 kinase [Termitinemataceae bacterium]